MIEVTEFLDNQIKHLKLLNVWNHLFLAILQITTPQQTLPVLTTWTNLLKQNMKCIPNYY